MLRTNSNSNLYDQKCQRFFNRKEYFEVIQLPSKSADSNPVEHIWGIRSQRKNVDPAWKVDECFDCLRGLYGERRIFRKIKLVM